MEHKLKSSCPLNGQYVGEVVAWYEMAEEPRYIIRRSQDVADYAIAECYLGHDNVNHREYVYCIYTNQAGQVLGHTEVSAGGLTGTIVDPKVILQTAILLNSPRLIMVHNHPSGSIKPSQQDIRLTQKIKHGAQLLDIHLTDHLIITRNGYYSFLDEDML